MKTKKEIQSRIKALEHKKEEAKASGDFASAREYLNKMIALHWVLGVNE